MADEAIKLGGRKRSVFIDKVKEILPEGGNLNLCLTCGACSSGCPATGLEGMDPRKFLRMAALGMDEEVLSTKWVWMCSMCTRCMYVCPMKINIPQLVFNARAAWPREKRPKGILGSCDMALRNDTCSAMGATEEDFLQSPDTSVDVKTLKRLAERLTLLPEKKQLFRKMERKAIGFEQLSDIYGFRVIVEKVEDCYRALGIVHTTWQMVPSRFKARP